MRYFLITVQCYGARFNGMHEMCFNVYEFPKRKDIAKRVLEDTTETDFAVINIYEFKDYQDHYRYNQKH